MTTSGPDFVLLPNHTGPVSCFASVNAKADKLHQQQSQQQFHQPL